MSQENNTLVRIDNLTKHFPINRGIIVQRQVGAVQAYDRMMGKYQALPFVPDVKADLVTHVVNGGLSGIFHYMAVEEAAIRKNPAKRTTEILKKVFGN